MRFCWLFALALSAGCAAPPAAEAPEPGGGAIARASGVQITMYMTSWCPVCQHAREWLDRRGYRFEMRDVEVDVRAGRELRSVNPRGSVPMFDVDGRILIGFEPSLLEDAIERAASQRMASLSEPGDAQ